MQIAMECGAHMAVMSCQIWTSIFILTYFLALSLTNETRSASPERLLVAATVVVDV